MLAGIVGKQLGAVAGAARQSSFESRRQLSYLTGSRITAATPRRGGYASNTFRPSPHRAIPSVRFSSSSTSPPAEGVSPAPGVVPDISEFNDPNLIDLAAIPERMGYLKSLGLDYGWGISTITEYIAEALHLYAGLPWWGTAVSVAVLIRIISFRPSLIATDQAARMQHAKELTSPLQSRIRECGQNGDTAGMQSARQQLQIVYGRYGVKPSLSALPLLQAVFQFCGYRVFSGMGSLPVPALELETVAWLPDVASSDPFYILPASMAALIYFSVKRSINNGLTIADMPGVQTLMLRVLPPLSFFFTCGLPGILQIYFVASSTLQFGHTYFMTRPAFRDWCNITPPPERAAKKAEEPTVDIEKQGPETNISFIDRAIEGVKKPITKVRSMYQKRVAAKQEDASTSHYRFTKKSELEQAKTYDDRRKTQEDSNRRKRNQERKKKHKENMKG